MTQQDSPQVAAIRARYKQSLNEKAALISEHLKSVNTFSEIESASTNSASIIAEQIHADLHKLAGSSGMYGYDDVAQCARLAMHDLSEGSLDDVKLRLAQLHSLLEQHA